MALGGYVYHVLNRANGRLPIFHKDGDYAALECILEEALDHVPGLRLLCYCLMPDRWHLVACPQADGELSDFAHWLTLTHTKWKIKWKIGVENRTELDRFVKCMYVICKPIESRPIFRLPIFRLSSRLLAQRDWLGRQQEGDRQPEGYMDGESLSSVRYSITDGTDGRDRGKQGLRCLRLALLFPL